MLILTRRIDERIFIGDEIVLSVLDIEGNRVKLGIQAPKEVAILREEIHARYARKPAANEARHDGADETRRSA